MVERVIEGIEKNGVNDFIFIIAPDDTAVVDYFRNRVTGNFQFICQHERKGMAHALQLATPLIKEDFILCACDNIVPEADMSKFIDNWKTTTKPDALLSLLEMPAEKICKSSAVCSDKNGRVLKIVEKPSIDNIPSNVASIALYIFSPKILTFLPKVQPSPRGEYELQDAIQMLIEEQGNVRGMLISGRKTVSSADDLLRINLEYLKNSSNEILSPLHGATTSGPLQIDLDVTIGQNCSIGPNVYLERNCIIENNVSIKNSIILSGTRVAAGSSIDSQVVA